MANAWNPGVSYSPGALVSYGGYVYIRSSFPPSATSGTPPNEEMSTDGRSVAIRTWTLWSEVPSSSSASYLTSYFRLIEPPYNSTDPTPEYSFSGAQFEESTAYGTSEGGTVEYDQFKSNISPTPDSPVCPAELCGVALQQPGVGSVICEANAFGDSVNPNKYNIFITFNHPLYFRRTITVLTRVAVTVTVDSPPSVTVTYDNTYTAIVPTDTNFCTVPIASSYYIPANAAFDIIVPNDVYGSGTSTVYDFAGAALSEVTPND
jgi:hypothetical protein